MKRREFIVKSASVGTFVSLFGPQLLDFSLTKHKKITILHTNDTHSHIDPFEASHPQFPNQGGAARRAKMIDDIRQENPNMLLLDAGDMFQGTPYFNFYGGELEIKLMNMLKYDASAIGNHEFDNGVESMAEQLQKANFDILLANYDFSKTAMGGIAKPYKIFTVDGVKIGVFGLGIELQGLVNKREYGETEYLSPIEITQDMVRILKKEEKCDLVICLSHLGYQYNSSKISDVLLAQQTQDIDLIIGGHTHTFLDKPQVFKNKIGKDVIVNQVGCFGLRLGRIDFYFEDNKQLESNNSNNMKVE
ncbi:MAG TPA: metallophosphatase [Flavobacterium sp.]|nr:metallophosphatase [Flavobacterium sp.]